MVQAGPAAARTGQTSAAVALSSYHVGARPVVVKLTLRYLMQCGYPGPDPIVITFPQRERVPATIAAAHVLVDGKPAPAVKVSGRVVTVSLPPPPQVMCDVIGRGAVKVAFTRAARLGNPTKVGKYAITAEHRKTLFRAPFRIKAVQKRRP